jgi:hypothetical protein
MIKTKMRSLLIAIFLTLAVSVGFVSGQTMQTASAANDALAALPASDGVVYLDVRRLLTEIVPRLLANDPATLAMMTSALNEASTKSGVNLLAIERVAVGVRFLGPIFPTAPKENIGVVVIVRGDSHASSVIEFLKRMTKGKLAEETYGGKVIYSEPLPAPPRKRTERATPALAMLDANTIAVGDLPQVRAAIDAAAGNGRIDSALVELATRDANALMGAAANVPDTIRQSLSASAPKDPMAQGIVKFLNSIKQTYSSVGATATDYNILTGARFESAEQAQSIGDVLQGLRQQAASFIPDQKIRGLLESLQITAQGDEVQLRANIKNEVVQEFIASIMKEKKKAEAAAAAAKPSAAKTKRTTKSRRGRRRRGL